MPFDGFDLVESAGSSRQRLTSLLSVAVTLPATALDFQKRVEITLRGIISGFALGTLGNVVWAQ